MTPGPTTPPQGSLRAIPHNQLENPTYKAFCLKPLDQARHSANTTMPSISIDWSEAVKQFGTTD